MVKISFVITHYKEPYEVCQPLFESIANQIGVDFDNLEVIVVEDGEKEDFLNLELLQWLPYNVIQLSQGHKGVSSARNYGLEHVTGDYVMFCDCDDRFINAIALHLYLKAIKQAMFDIVKTPFLEDQVIDGELKLIRHDQDITFIHGKMYRVDFLKENGIKFNNELTIHEDAFFNVIANMLSEGNIHEMSPAVYLWKYRDESVVRVDRDAYVFKTYDHLMKSRKAICRDLEKRERYAEFYQAVSKTFFDSYYDFQRPDCFKEENKEIIEKAERAFAGFYNEFKDEFKNVNINDKAVMAHICRVNGFNNGMKMERETFPDFLRRIVKTYLS